jgi:hypothetical protein
MTSNHTQHATLATHHACTRCPAQHHARCQLILQHVAGQLAMDVSHLHHVLDWCVIITNTQFWLGVVLATITAGIEV